MRFMCSAGARNTAREARALLYTEQNNPIEQRQRNGEPHVVVPDHNPMKPGTFHGIPKDGATHHRISVEELLRLLDL